MESQAKAAAYPVTSCKERSAGGFAGQSRSLPCAFLLKLPRGMYRYCKQNTVHTQLAELSGNSLSLTQKGIELQIPNILAAGQLRSKERAHTVCRKGKQNLAAKTSMLQEKGIGEAFQTTQQLDCSRVKDLFLQRRLLGNKCFVSRFATGIRHKWNRRPRPQSPP